jgi:hypothetical protein
MKPQHAGFLLVGAALAGGLAIKMTQAPMIPVVDPAPQPERLPVITPVVSTVSPGVSTLVAKPSPIPRAPTLTPARAAAPQPVYDEPAKPVIRKSKPIFMATARPTQWTPGPYEGPVGPVSPKPQPAIVELPIEQPVEQKVAPEPLPPVPAPRRVTLQTGMTIPIRLDESLSSDKSVVGEMFQASLVEPLVVDGLVIAEKGARVVGRIVNSQKAILELGLANLMTSDGQRVAISTDPWMNGAAIPLKTIIRFRLASRVTVTEQQISEK